MNDIDRPAPTPPTRWDRLLARLRAQALNEQLASGASPDDGGQRAARAAALVALRARDRLAGHWEGVLERVHRPSTTTAAVPLAPRRILAVEDDIRAMAAALRAPLPVPARGVALARVLLTDGTGPLYNVRARDDLGTAVRHATRYLDPATPLSTPGERVR